MRIKVCGITTLEDAEEAQRLGAWGIGLNHHPESPRFVARDVAAEIGTALKRRCEMVGIFVNAPLREVERAVEEAQLTMVQLHGDEGPAYCAEIARRTGAKVIKAARVSGASDLQSLERFRTDFHLLDTKVEGKRGGSGESWDWSLAAQRRSKVPAILSGGLTADNVADGIAQVRPYAVDVASGVEAEPGVKDPAKLEAFMAVASPARAAIP
jgi:phosphoribosylanthranilate isomerase